MKKILISCISLIFVFCLTACGSKTESTKVDATKSVSSASSAESVKLDYDLTSFNFTMYNSQYINIIENFNQYKGDLIRIKGTFLVEETENRNYYACKQNDTSACCSPGFEFRLKDTSLKYPEEYPKQNTEITVQGYLSSYNEGENVYYELTDAEIL